MFIQALEHHNRKNHTGVILIKPSFKQSQSLMYFEQEKRILCVPQRILYNIKKT